MKVRCAIISVLLAALLVACSGGGGKPGTIDVSEGDAGKGGGAGSSAGAAGATGAAAGSTGGASGTTGTGGTAAPAGGIAAGVLYPCPEPPPTDGDACPNDFITCTYPGAKSCACYDQTWTCFDCPASQPAATETCNDLPFRLSLSCRYGDVACACERRSTSAGWRCGACPAAKPASGGACSAPAGECRYGTDTCLCGDDGKWNCTPALCPANPTFTPTRSSCSSPKSAYTCSYPEQDQNCLCLPNLAGDALDYLCSCPGSRPASGSRCIGSVAACSYGAVACSCAGGSWSCA
jgi:hypothetical protein